MTSGNLADFQMDWSMALVKWECLWCRSGCCRRTELPLSVILSCVASVFLFDFVPTKIFVVGAVTVLAATYMYNNHGGVDSFIEESIACFCVRKRRNSMPEEEFLLSIEEDVKDDMKMRSSIGTTPKSSSTTKNSFSLHNN
ncbi:unnamed protein product [Heterosigma akashiwo]